MTISPAYGNPSEEVKLQVFDAVEAEKIIDDKLAQIANLFNELEVELDQYPVKNVTSAVLKFIKLRDKLSIGRKSFENFESFAKNHQEVINQFLLAKSDEEGGVQNFSTPYGTAYRKTKVAFRVQDWPSYADWMQENDMLHCVEKRPAKMAVQEYFDSVNVENDAHELALKSGEITQEEFESRYKVPTPPGLERHVEIEFGFRK